jgi:hypothetical protein
LPPFVAVSLQVLRTAAAVCVATGPPPAPMTSPVAPW